MTVLAITTAQASDNTPCLERLHVDADHSLLAEQRRSGPPLPDFQPRFRSVAIDPELQQPVRLVERFQVGATPLLWFSEDRREAVVNQAVFSGLEMVDAPKLTAGERREIGSVTDLAFSVGMLPGRELLRFLIEAQVILTYWHLEADLCIEQEVSFGAHGYRARVSGRQVFYTDRENERDYGFVFELLDDGLMLVTGL